MVQRWSSSLEGDDRQTRPTVLILVRHGQTEGNSSRLLHGRTDLPLDRTGEEQARQVAARIANEFSPATVVTSPLIRARATAIEIASRLGLTPDEIPGLSEMDFGDLEGYSFERLVAEYPEISARALDSNNLHLVWPNGDSVSDFHQRVLAVFEEIVSGHDGRTTVVVSHNGVLGSYLAQLRGLPPNDWQAYRLANCSISVVEFSRGKAAIVQFNDSSHLDRPLEALDSVPAP
jgi:probable phosphoglycerate mutase